MQFDLVVNDESVERCFLEYDEVGYGYDEDDIVTVRVQEVYQSNKPKVIITWHDENFKNDINAVRLLNVAKEELLSEYRVR